MSKFVAAPAVLIVFLLGVLLGFALDDGDDGNSVAASAGPGVTGIGGVFFKSPDADASRAWYRENLGLDGTSPGVNFFWRDRSDPARFGFTVWSVFAADSEYFGSPEQSFMINYRVDDLDALLADLRGRGVQQVGEVEEYWYGRFAWVIDIDGNRVELWEPVDFPPEEFERRAGD